MTKPSILKRILHRLSGGIAPGNDAANSDLLNRLALLENELTELKARNNFPKVEDSLSDLKAQIQSLKSSMVEIAKDKLPKRDDLSKSALIADSAVFSEESLIENTHGDRTKISVGEHSYVRGRLLTYGHGGAITIGDWCYVGARTEIWSMDSISIGDRVLISHDVNIHDGTAHSANPAERHEHFKTILLKGHPQTINELPGVKSAPIVIEDDAWISFGVTILRGVTIGAGSVIAAGAIVTKDVPPNVLYQCEITPTYKSLPESYKSVRAAVTHRD
jgi:maltose O-acetyltransferase